MYYVSAFLFFWIAVSTVVGCVLAYDNIRSRLRLSEAHERFFHKCNRLTGKRVLLTLIKIFFISGALLWCSLVFLLMLDPIFLGWFTELRGGEIVTPLGVVDDENQYWVLGAVFFGIIGAKATPFVVMVASVLKFDHIGVDRLGRWGPVSSNIHFN